ncbi:MAG: YcxB family protein [Oscillibacter sp.]
MEKHYTKIKVLCFCVFLTLALTLGMAKAAGLLSIPAVCALYILLVAGALAAWWGLEQHWYRAFCKQADALLPLLDENPDRFIAENENLLAHKIFPQIAAVLRLRICNIYCDKGDYAQAQRQLDSINSKKTHGSQRAVYFASCAYVAFRLGETDRAIALSEQSQRALRRSERSPQAGALIALLQLFLLVETGRWEEARTLYATARPRWENDSTRDDFEALREKLFPAETENGGGAANGDEAADGGEAGSGAAETDEAVDCSEMAADGNALPTADGETAEIPLFRVNVPFTFQDFLALQILAGRLYRKWLTYFLRPLVGGLGLFIGLGSVLVLLTDAFTVGWLLYALFGLAGLLCALFLPRLNALGARRGMQNHVSGAEFRFYPAAFTTVSSQGITTRPYTTILALYRFRERYFIFFDRRHALFLPFAAFDGVNREEFKCFLSKKTGKIWESKGRGKSNRSEINC